MFLIGKTRNAGVCLQRKERKSRHCHHFLESVCASGGVIQLTKKGKLIKASNRRKLRGSLKTTSRQALSLVFSHEALINQRGK